MDEGDGLYFHQRGPLSPDDEAVRVAQRDQLVAEAVETVNERSNSWILASTHPVSIEGDEVVGAFAVSSSVSGPPGLIEEFYYQLVLFAMQRSAALLDVPVSVVALAMMRRLLPDALLEELPEGNE